jgi:bifunctional enzyme CysN/CysC
MLLWFTGVSGAGKSTIAALVERRLFESGQHTYVLDADAARAGLNADLGFTAEDRAENVRRLGECAKLLLDAGLVVLVTSISPYSQGRLAARESMTRYRFIEVFVDTPIAVAQQRDPKGLYAKYADGKLKLMAGLDAPYERPENAELVVETVDRNAADCADAVVAYVLAGLNS